MDSSSIGALTGTADSSKKKKSTSSPGDADAFSSAMGAAESADAEGSKKAELISKDKSAKEKEVDKAEAKKRDNEQADKQAAKNDEAKQKKGQVNEFLKNITTGKDPAALSMAERQTFRMGEFAANQKPMSSMMQMLQSQGIDMTSFTPQQIMSLLSRMDTKELGKMMSQMKAMGVKVDEETVAQLKEQMNSAQNNNAAKEPANFNIQDFAAAGMPKEAGETARAEQRRAVMDQLLTKIQVRNVANQTEMQLRLNPEYLGEVKISLIHDKEGGVKATFQTTSKLTREILAENKDELMEKARSNGVRIGEMDVEFVDELTA
ncbi:MAG: flagellar hook-length control protein FliK [Vulcanimicrobiota bacterium]